VPTSLGPDTPNQMARVSFSSLSFRFVSFLTLATKVVY
jgi:hypothetical protein